MGDYSEHVLFGLLSGFLVFYLFSDILYIDLQVSVWSVMMVLAGSVVPDIDHPNSYVRRSFQALVSFAVSFTAFFLPFRIQIRFLLGVSVFILSYGALSRLDIVHRGFFHSISFAAIFSSLIVILSVIVVSSPLPGMAAGVGVLSHLVLDSEFKIS